MSKKAKTLIFSASGLAVLIVLTLVLLLMQDDETIGEEPLEILPDNRIIFTDFSPEDIVSIEVRNEHGEYTIIAENGSFAVPQLFSAPLLDSRLQTAARNMSAFHALELVEENAENLEQYGLNSTAARGFAAFTNGETLEVFVGDNAPTSELLTYVRIDNNVYAVQTFLVDFLRQNAFHYVSLSVTPDFQFGTQIESLIIDRIGEQRYHINAVRLGEDELALGTHKFTLPVEVEIDPVRGERLLQGLFGLRAEAVASVEKNLLERRLDHSFAVVEMTVGGRTSTLIIDGNFHGIHSDYPDVGYLFSPQSLAWFLDLDVESVMSTRIHMPMIYLVSELVIETPAHKLSFRFTGEDQHDEQYFLNGELVDAEHFKSLYRYVISMSATGLYEGEPENIEDMPFLARFTYSYRGTRPDDVFEFYDSGGMRAIISVNGTPRFTQSIGYSDRLAENLELYLNGEALILTWL